MQEPKVSMNGDSFRAWGLYFEVPNLVPCSHILTEWAQHWCGRCTTFNGSIEFLLRNEKIQTLGLCLTMELQCPFHQDGLLHICWYPKMYLGNLMIYSNSWHRALKHRLTSSPRLTVNLAKCEFAHATVTYFGHVVKPECVAPVYGRVMAVRQLPQATAKKELMRFLRMAGYCRCLCQSFSTLVAPISDLLKS